MQHLYNCWCNSLTMTEVVVKNFFVICNILMKQKLALRSIQMPEDTCVDIFWANKEGCFIGKQLEEWLVFDFIHLRDV